MVTLLHEGPKGLPYVDAGVVNADDVKVSPIGVVVMRVVPYEEP